MSWQLICVAVIYVKEQVILIEMIHVKLILQNVTSSAENL